MSLPSATRVDISQEGIEDLADFVELNDKSFKQITDNLRRPRVHVPDTDPNAAAGATVPTPSFFLCARCQLRLKATFKIAGYYETNGHAFSAAKIHWNPIINNFTEHWKSLTLQKDATYPEVPMISKNLHVIKWTKDFSDFTRCVICTRTIPLSYVIRETVVVPSLAPPLITNQPYADEFGLPLYCDENTSLYFYFEETACSTMYTSSI